MDASRLDGAYRPLLCAARAVAERADAVDAHGPMCWMLSHLALYDENLTQAARQIAAGDQAIVDSTAAMCADIIGGLVARHTPSELVDLVADNATKLIAALETIPEDRIGTAVRVRLFTRTGKHVFDEWLAWRDVIEVRAEEQLPHSARYIALLAETVGVGETGILPR